MTASIPSPDVLIEELRKLHRSGMSLAGMARDIGLHHNSLNRLNEKDWRPRLDTLMKIHDWLRPAPEQPVETEVIRLAGDGWEIVPDPAGWWVLSSRGDAKAMGPYKDLQSAAQQAEKVSSE